MLRRVGAVIFSFFSGFSLFVILQGYLASHFPPPEDLIPQDIEATTAYFRSLPDKFFIYLVLAHGVAALTASFIATKIADKYKVYIGWLVGGMFLIAGISHIVTIPTPGWVLIADPIFIIMCVVLGPKLALRK